MSGDPYQLLGVKKDAKQSEIQSAFRKLAKKLHPDVNPGDKKAEDQFKQVSAAYELLSDPEKRGRFDRGEIDINGTEQAPRGFHRQYSAAGGEDPFFSGANFGDAEDLFSRFFSQRGQSGGFKAKGSDRHYSMEVDFLSALNGTKNQMQLPDGSSLEVAIPAGTRDGQTLRLRGKGEPGLGGGPAGDALIEVRVRPHAFFTRDGDDIRLELPVSLSEAVLGGKIRVPTPTGAVQLTLPPNSSSGKTLRVKGKGAPNKFGGHGDLYVSIRIVLPDAADPELAEFIRKWSEDKTFNPRRAMEAGN